MLGPRTALTLLVSDTLTADRRTGLERQSSDTTCDELDVCLLGRGRGPQPVRASHKGGTGSWARAGGQGRAGQGRGSGGSPAWPEGTGACGRGWGGAVRCGAATRPCTCCSAACAGRPPATTGAGSTPRTREPGGPTSEPQDQAEARVREASNPVRRLSSPRRLRHAGPPLLRADRLPGLPPHPRMPTRTHVIS